MRIVSKNQEEQARRTDPHQSDASARKQVIERYIADPRGRLGQPPPSPPPPNPPPPSPPPPITETGVQGLCRFPCSGIPSERLASTAHLPWRPKGAACEHSVPC